MAIWQPFFIQDLMATINAATKDAAVSFLQSVASGRVREAFARHVGHGFRHHNPYFAGDAEALMTGMEENARQNPDKRLDILRTLQDGDLVAVHSHVRHARDDRGAALMHLFRFEGDRIVELWDIGQPVPETTVNTNGMF
jgi:predicted SnoaL-like aldol condensation-catalyzing enzyme